MNLNVLGNAKATATMLTSVSGLKTFLERLGAYGAATSIAYAGVPELGGQGTAAMFKSLGLKGASGPLAPVGAAWFGAHWSYVQFLIGFGAILGIGSNSDIPALFTAMSLFLCGNTMIAGSSHGVRDVFIRNAMAFKYSNAILLLLTTRKARGYFSSKQAAALRKLAIAVPGLMMSFLMMQGSSMAKFTAAGMTGPGVLGPVAGLIFHPLHHVVSACVALGYISGYSTRRAALFLCLELSHRRHLSGAATGSALGPRSERHAPRRRHGFHARVHADELLHSEVVNVVATTREPPHSRASRAMARMKQ